MAAFTGFPARLRAVVGSRRFFLFIWILMLVIGFVTVPGYGRPSDEPLEQTILKANYLEYISQIFGSDSELTQLVDASGSIQRISQSNEKDHGIAAYYLFAPFFKLPGDRAVMLAWHAYTFVLFMLGVAALYGIVKKLTRRKWLPYLAAAMLYLSPRMFAEGHYNNKDIVLLSLVLITIHCGIRYIQSHSLRHGILFAIAGAFAANGRLPGFWTFSLVGASYIGLLIRNREFTKKRLGIGLLTILAFIAVYFLLTPASWENPVGFFQYMLRYSALFDRSNGAMFFNGEIIRASGGTHNLPWYYLPYVFFLTTPLYIQALILLGIALLLSRLFAHKNRRTSQNTALFGLILTLWMVPFVFAICARTFLYNGWRHMYFCYGPMLITAIYALEFLLDRLNPVPKRILVAVVCALVALTGVEDVVNHPYQYAYFNVIGRQNAGEAYEIDYWHVSGTAIMEKLVACENRNTDLPILLSAADVHTGDALKKNWSVLPDATRSQISITEDYESANYWLYCPYYEVFGVDISFPMRKIASVTAYGKEVISVFERITK